MNKRRNKVLTKSLSGLIVSVLAIMAFIRGPWANWLMIAVFAIWAAVSLGVIIVAHSKQKQYTRRAKPKAQQNPPAEIPFEFPDLDSPSDFVLLQHVNHRISSYLKATYPDVTWEWLTPEPVDAVIRGGKGHIKVFGAGEFNEAMVTFDERARINFHMMRVVPLAVVQGKESAGQDRVPASLPVDVKVWYDVSGKSILADLVADLESRGHSNLIIKENGDICISQDSEEVVQDTLFNMPDQVHWPLLVKVMGKDGLAAKVEETGIVVGW